MAILPCIERPGRGVMLEEGSTITVWLVSSLKKGSAQYGEKVRCPALALHGENAPYVVECSYQGNEAGTTGEYRFELIPGAERFMHRTHQGVINRILQHQLDEWRQGLGSSRGNR